jgi:carbonic anhydrase
MTATAIETLNGRNRDFASHRHVSSLKMMPSMKTLIIGCVDPRVDPVDVLGVQAGEAAIIRNVGGRVTPSTIDTLAMLRQVTRAAGGDLAAGWNLVVLHHTDCGITRLGGAPKLLAGFFGISPDRLHERAIDDPRASVALDIDALRASPEVSGDVVVTGLVYDVATGLVETVVAPSLLRPAVDPGGSGRQQAAEACEKHRSMQDTRRGQQQAARPKS